MNFDGPHLICGFIFSGIGFIYFSYGKKQGVLPLVIAGAVLMFYTYAVDSIPWIIGLGIAISAAPWFIR